MSLMSSKPWVTGKRREGFVFFFLDRDIYSSRPTWFRLLGIFSWALQRKMGDGVGGKIELTAADVLAPGPVAAGVVEELNLFINRIIAWCGCFLVRSQIAQHSIDGRNLVEVEKSSY